MVKSFNSNSIIYRYSYFDNKRYVESIRCWCLRYQDSFFLSNYWHTAAYCLHHRQFFALQVASACFQQLFMLSYCIYCDVYGSFRIQDMPAVIYHYTFGCLIVLFKVFIYIIVKWIVKSYQFPSHSRWGTKNPTRGRHVYWYDKDTTLLSWIRERKLPLSYKFGVRNFYLRSIFCTRSFTSYEKDGAHHIWRTKGRCARLNK